MTFQNFMKQYWQALAFAGIVAAGSVLTACGGCSYFGGKTEESEQKKDKSKLEQMVKDESWERYESNQEISYKFKETLKIPKPIELNVQNRDTATLLETKLLLPIQQAHREQIGDRKLTGYEVLQILGRNVNLVDFHRDLSTITLNEVMRAIKRIDGKSPEEIRKIVNLDLDAPYYQMLANDPELYAQALKEGDGQRSSTQERCNIPQRVWQARNEQQARAYRSELARNREYNAAFARQQAAKARGFR